MIRLLITIALAGAGIFVLQNYVRPDLAEVQNIRSEQAVVADAISNAREVIRKRDELLGRYNSISSADIDKIRKFLPAGSAITELLIDVDELADSAGVHVQSIGFQESVASAEDMPSDMSALQLSLTVTGQYDDFRSFITLLESNLRLIDVITISLNGGGRSGNNGADEISFNLELQAYYQERTIL
jgi:Tfp pilus assembly protein PilO